MTAKAAAALQQLNGWRAARVIRDWRLDVSARNGELAFTAVVVPFRRRADMTLGKRHARPWYSDPFPILADQALIDAARYVVQHYPEASQ